MSAKFPRGGGGAGPFSARSLIGLQLSNTDKYIKRWLENELHLDPVV